MALRHVKEYFLTVERDYLEMCSLLKDIEEDAANGKIPPDVYESLTSDAQRLRDNYERLAYVMYLFNIPNRKDKDENERLVNVYNSLQSASKEAVLHEDADVLKHFRKLIEENKNESETV